MRLALLAAAALLAGLAPAQRYALGVNDRLPWAGNVGSVNNWFALRAQAPASAPLPVIGLEFYCQPTQPTLQIALYDEDPVTAKPRTQLALAAAPAVPYPVWQGGVFAQPVIFMPGQRFFVAFYNQGGGMSIAKGGVPQVHYWNSTWSGPHSTVSWCYRIYLPGGTGTWTPYGAGSAGSAGTPALLAQGWPNVGNPLGLLMTHVPNSGNGFLLLGRQIPGLPLGPLGTLYTFPILATFPLASATAGNYAHFMADLPNDPFLAGATLSWQGWFLDPAAAAGVIHSDGQAMAIGG